MFGQNTRGELVGAHFQTEERAGCADRLLVIDAIEAVAPQPVCSIECDVRRQRGFAHARTSGQNDKVRLVQPADFLIERGEPGGGA